MTQNANYNCSGKTALNCFIQIREDIIQLNTVNGETSTHKNNHKGEVRICSIVNEHLCNGSSKESAQSRKTNINSVNGNLLASTKQSLI